MDHEWLTDELSLISHSSGSREENSTASLVRPSKCNIVEYLLFNVANLLASIGAGYDVRISNISPVHPKLLPERKNSGDSYSNNSRNEELMRHKWWLAEIPRSHFSNPEYDSLPNNYTAGFARNTYHGPKRHYRPALMDTIDAKPLRFTDSPQHASSYVKPSGTRRKSSVSSIEITDVSYPPPPAPSGGTYSSPDSSSRSDYYKSTDYYQPGYQQYTGLEYTFTDDQHNYSIYENPINSNNNTNSNTRNERLYYPGRTSSNTSAASAVSSTPLFHTDIEQAEIYHSPYLRRAGDYSSYFSKHDSTDSPSNVSERPTTLDVTPTKLRSSLKKTNYLPPGSIRSQNTAGSPSSGPGSPMNPTPPDSLTSEDSSYMSAKDSSSNSVSRVRFSPSTLMDSPVMSYSQSQELSLSPSLYAIKRSYSNQDTSTTRVQRQSASTSEYERDFLS